MSTLLLTDKPRPLLLKDSETREITYFIGKFEIDGQIEEVAGYIDRKTNTLLHYGYADQVMPPMMPVDYLGFAPSPKNFPA